MIKSIYPGVTADCPHCRTHVRFEKVTTEGSGTPMNVKIVTRVEVDDPDDKNPSIILNWAQCPSCSDTVVQIQRVRSLVNVRLLQREYIVLKQLWPVATLRKNVPAEVPEDIRRDYEETAAVEIHSARAAAALARRCLQAALHHQGIVGKDLNAECDLAAKDPRIGSSLSQKLHRVRQAGNYAAHPLPDGNGAYLEVEPGELDWLFVVLDDLFDVLWVKPAEDARQMAAISAKTSTANAVKAAAKAASGPSGTPLVGAPVKAPSTTAGTPATKP